MNDSPLVEAASPAAADYQFIDTAEHLARWIESTQTHKSWIDSSGRLKKDEYKTTNPKSGSTVLTMEYEVDPTIRVEAPIK